MGRIPRHAEPLIPALLATVLAVAVLLCPSTSVRSAGAQFRDVAGSSKFTYISNNDFRSRKYFIQPMCGGVGILDYDNDGKLDLFFTNGAELPSNRKTSSTFYNSLMRNRGDGVFEDRTKEAGLEGADLGYSLGVAAGDYDNDGRSDLFIAGAGRNALYHNNGNGAFSDVTARSGLADKPDVLLSVGAAWFDMDNDGLLDLVVSNYTNWTPASDIRCLNPAQEDMYCSPKTYSSVPNLLYRNLGGGKFENVTRKSGFTAAGKGMGISIADYNGDGFQDVFIANDTERNFLFMNQGAGTFKEEGLKLGVAFNDDGVAVSGMGSDAKDVNNDGFVDIFYNDLATQLFALHLNDGGRTFHYASHETRVGLLSRRFSGWSAGFIDYDNDGWKDIYSANGDVDNLSESARQHDTMFANAGGKTFRDVSSEMGEGFRRLGFQRGSAFVDLNDDGALDIVITALKERPRVLMNAGTPGNHWIELDLTGTVSNRDAIGATVKVTTASGRTLYNHVAVSVGFLSSSDKRVHFGLGADASVNTVEIRWPSGIVQKIEGAAVDRVVRIKEPPREK